MKYDVSIIMPYYKKYNEFKYALQKNKKQLKLVNEVIIVFDEIIDISKFEYLKDYNINFRFFTNTENHSWRNPAVVLNHGIKNAKSEYCIIISPESILMPNFIKNIMNNTNDTNFSTGKVIFVRENNLKKLTIDDLDNLFEKEATRNHEFIGPVYFGSLCCKKNNLEKTFYDEKFIGWGGEDDDIRKRLINIGLIQNNLNNVKIIHSEDDISFNKRLYRTQNYKLDHRLYNKFIEINNKPIKINYTPDNFIDFKMKEKIFSYYPIILLCQCYNEEHHIKDFLQNVNSFVDGIIILDDSSTDKSWELMISDKILFKAQKKRETFNDLENRNLLLEIFNNLFIKNNIRVDWFIWLDFDERINNCKNTISELRNMLLLTENKNIFNIPFVHMWNENEYNTEYPSSQNGIQYHTRLIRNIVDYAPYKIISNKSLHFKLNPYDNEKYTFPLLIKHLGRNSENVRVKKYNLYTQKYDIGLKNQISYNHFLNNSPKLNNYEINKNNILFDTLKKTQIVILHDYGQKHIKYIKKSIMSPLLVKVKHINHIPSWLDNKKHKVLLVIENEELLINIKTNLNNNKIVYIGSENTKIIKPENNNYYIGVLNNKAQILCKYVNNNINEIFIQTINRKKLQDEAINYFQNNNGKNYGLITVKFINEKKYEFINIDTNPSIKKNSIFTLSTIYNGINYRNFIENLIN